MGAGADAHVHPRAGVREAEKSQKVSQNLQARLEQVLSRLWTLRDGGNSVLRRL